MVAFPMVDALNQGWGEANTDKWFTATARLPTSFPYLFSERFFHGTTAVITDSCHRLDIPVIPDYCHSTLMMKPPWQTVFCRA